MQISGFGSSDISNTSITSRATTTIHSSVSSNAYGSSDVGIFIDPLDAIAVVDETKKSAESLSAYRLLSKLTTDIQDNHSLAGVQDAIDTYTSSLASPNVYGSAYSAPSASFLADLNALKNDAESNDLSAAVADLAKAKADAPRIPGPYSDSASLQTLSLLNSIYTANGASPSGVATATADNELTS
jgi:hypothetical protein